MFGFLYGSKYFTIQATEKYSAAMYYWFWCLLLITIILSNDIKKLVVTFVSVFCCHGWSWVPYMEDWSLHADHLKGEACYDAAHIKLLLCCCWGLSAHGFYPPLKLFIGSKVKRATMRRTSSWSARWRSWERAASSWLKRCTLLLS